MNEKCLIVAHLSVGDLLIVNSIIRYYTTIYNNVYFICKKNNIKSMINIFSDNKHIIPISIDINEDIIPFNHIIYDKFNDYDIIKLGMHNNNWNILKFNFMIDNLPYLFFKTFYQQLDFDYNMRYKFEKINRNYKNEITFFNNVMKKYDKYIFIHDIRNNNNEYKNYEKFVIDSLNFYDKIIPIFHPNINYYNNTSLFYDYWQNIISDNILDYCHIIENAEEIHLVFSSFLNLCVFLDLSKVKKKYIYTNIINIKELHKNLNDWEIIYI
jgi:hypothetical protein